MAVLRAIGLLFIAVALMALGSDTVSSLESGTVSIRSLADFWRLFHEPSLETFLAWASETLPASVVDPGLLGVLSFPAWATLGSIGIIIALIFRKRD